jgi:competence protein ComGC
MKPGGAIEFPEQQCNEKEKAMQTDALIRSLLISVILLMLVPAYAQEKRHLNYQSPADNTKYLQQHVIDAGDVKGHQVRIYEIKKTYAKDTFVLNGVNVVEEWIRGYSDYIDGNGRNWGYTAFMLENGDKVFARYDGNSQTVIAPDGAKKGTGISTAILTGGTGKFRTIRGTIRGSYSFDPSRGYNAGQFEGDYWFDD